MIVCTRESLVPKLNSATVRSLAAFVGVALVSILAVGAGAAFYQSGQTVRQGAIPPGNSESGFSAGGLLLGLQLNSSEVRPGQAVAVTVSERNTLGARNEVEAAQKWGAEGLAVGPCGSLNYPFGFAVFSGNYSTSSGLSSAKAAQLYQPGIYFCPEILAGVDSYVFSPLSDEAEVTCGGTPEPCLTLQMNVTSDVGRSWTGNSSEALSPGVYTVVAGDEWGALLFRHFVVSSQGGEGAVVLPLGSGFNVSSSFDCVAGHYAVNFTAGEGSLLAGAFTSSEPGVTLYVATAEQAGSVYQGHPSSWVFTTGLVNSSSISVLLHAGSYVAWFEGADRNCGAQIVMPLEQLTMVNVTEAFTVGSG
jgi:hypothetical protein